MDSLKGWTVTGDSALIKRAHLQRHPRHTSYIPVSEVKPFPDAEAKTYDKLNKQLHDELRRVSREHFADTPVPRELQSDREPYFTPFTYQNYDWYGPSYECYIQVIGDYITAELLGKFQSLLVGDHHDWCIQVVISKSSRFDGDVAIAIFSDQIIVPEKAADALRAPRR